MILQQLLEIVMWICLYARGGVGMSRTLKLSQIEAHMRSQSNEYLLGWLEISKGVEAELHKNGFNEPKDTTVDNLAISILRERGVKI